MVILMNASIKFKIMLEKPKFLNIEAIEVGIPINIPVETANDTIIDNVIIKSPANFLPNLFFIHFSNALSSSSSSKKDAE